MSRRKSNIVIQTLEGGSKIDTGMKIVLPVNIFVGGSEEIYTAVSAWSDTIIGK
jgi:hypothetical protein